MGQQTYGNQCLNCGFVSYTSESPLGCCRWCAGLDLHVWLVPNQERVSVFAGLRLSKQPRLVQRRELGVG